MQQEADAVLGQVGVVVPALDDGADIETVVLAEVISATWSMNAESSLVASSPLAVSRLTL